MPRATTNSAQANGSARGNVMSRATDNERSTTITVNVTVPTNTPSTMWVRRHHVSDSRHGRSRSRITGTTVRTCGPRRHGASGKPAGGVVPTHGASREQQGYSERGRSRCSGWTMPGDAHRRTVLSVVTTDRDRVPRARAALPRLLARGHALGRGWLEVLPVLLVAILQVGATAGAGHNQPERSSLDALGVALLLAGPAALLVRRRRPEASLAVAFAAALAYWLTD